jgi:hypothetical protein
MKKILALAILLSPWIVAQAATKYYCDCDTGSHPSCIRGDEGSDGSTPALAKRLFSTYITNWKAGAAGDQFLLCQGGAWDSGTQTVASGGNLNNSNATAANPIVTDWYDATAVWSGGAGIQPLLKNAAATRIFDIAQGTLTTARNGYTYRHLNLDGGGTNTQYLMGIGGGHNYITLDTMTFNASGGGIQCNGATTSAPAGGQSVAKSEHLNVLRSTITNMTGIGILTSCNDTRIEDNTFDHNGTNVTDHHIYTTGMNVARAVPTISSITGDGTTVTVTTTAPHDIWTGVPTTRETAATISGVTGGTGSWGITLFTAGSAITYVSPTQFSYKQTANGTGSGGSITGVRQVVPGTEMVIRGNTLTNANVGAAGSCGEAAYVAHGEWAKIIIENNLFREDVATSSGSCAAIEFSDGGYEPPEKNNAMSELVISNNTCINYATCVGVDLTANVLIQNNFDYTEAATTGGAGFNLRVKNNTPAAAYSGTATSGGASTLTDTGKTFSGLTANRSTVKITGGTGAGQRATILSNTATQLTMTAPWATPPDNTSTYTVSVQSGIPVFGLDPDKVTIRYNTTYRTNPDFDTAGIRLNGNATDNLSGRNHNLYGNVVILGTTATTATKCFDTSNMTMSWFDTKDYNSCYYLGASVPKWENTSTLAAVQGAGTPTDTHSTFAATTSVTADQPFFTAPTTSPATGASSALIGGGVPGVKPNGAWGGFKRAASPTDRGAYERGAATALPNSQTRIGATAP